MILCDTSMIDQPCLLRTDSSCMRSAGSPLSPWCLQTPAAACKNTEGLKAGERLIDLGAGDGRVLITAIAEYGAGEAVG